MTKILVAYFSATGTTGMAATALADVAGADLYEITPEVPYTNEDLNWRDDFRLIACQVEDWNRDLSPWEASPVFGKEGFGGRAEETLRELQTSSDLRGCGWREFCS